MMDLGKDPKAGRGQTSLKEALEAYLEGNASLRPSSVKGYRGSCMQYLGDSLEKPLGEITGEMVEKKHGEIGKGSGQKQLRMRPSGHSGRSTTSWRNGMGRCRQTQLQLLKRRWFKIERRTRMVKFDQLKDFYSALGNLESKVAADYVRLLLFTGLRRTEAASIKWGDVDFAARTFTIPGERTKNGNALTLPMSDLVSDLLVARRAVGKMEHVFPANSKTGHIEEPKDAFDEIAEASGIRVSAHDLRRTFMTIAESLDISPLAIKALANHAPPRDVTSGYVVVKTERLTSPRKRLPTSLSSCAASRSQRAWRS